MKDGTFGPISKEKNYFIKKSTSCGLPGINAIPALFICSFIFCLLGYSKATPDSSSGSFTTGMDNNIQSINNEEQTHLFQTPQHYSPDEHEYQALEPHQQQYLDSSPEFYTANHIIEPKFNPAHNYVKNYIRSKYIYLLK